MLEFAMHRFNHRRLLEPIGYVPPAEYEARYYEQAAVA
jgi:putative transposase